MCTPTPSSASPSVRATPRIWRRRLIPCLLLPLVLVGLVLTGWWWGQPGRPGLDWVVVGTLPPVALFAGALVGRLRLARLKRTVDRTRGLVCPDCGFDLSGSPEIGPCPECGIVHDVANVTRAWRDCGWLPREAC